MSDANVDDRLPQVMTGHIKTAAYAGECRLCPPPLFLILVSFLQIGFFVHQVRVPFRQHIQLVPFREPIQLVPF